MKKFLITGALTCVLLSGCNSVSTSQTGTDSSQKSTSSSVASVPFVNPLPSEPSQPLSSAPAKSLPASIPSLPVPFSSQAPLANWDALHEESCEEMAMLMVVHYLKGTPLTPEIAEQEIQDLVAWEHQNGYGDDLTAAQMAEVAEKKLGVHARVRTDVTIDSIKEELAAGSPVVIPAAGRDLGNPYFSGDGPWYHALTIIGFKPGWTGDYFVTNDPGTKRGQQYTYRAQTLLDAIHDWTGVKEDIRNGKKAMVILER